MVDRGGKWRLRWRPVGIGGMAVGAARTPRTRGRHQHDRGRNHQGVRWQARAPARPEGSVGTAIGLPPALRAALLPRLRTETDASTCSPRRHSRLMATETYREGQKRGEMSRDEQRALAANAFDAAVDAQGRISIDRDLRELRRHSSSAPGWWSRGPSTGSRSGTPSPTSTSSTARRPGPQGLGLTALANRPGPAAHDLTQPTNREGGRGTNRERRTRTCSAHPQSPGRQDGQPQLRPLPSR